jgi:hypothetical protein
MPPVVLEHVREKPLILTNRRICYTLTGKAVEWLAGGSQENQ